MTIKYNLYGKLEELTASPELLNHLCVALNESARYNDSVGCAHTAKLMGEEADAIYNQLCDTGLYDGSGVLIEAVDND